MSNPSVAPSPIRYGLARHRPPGQWAPIARSEPLVGTLYRVDEVAAFTAAVRRAEKLGLRYGLRLEHIPAGFERDDTVAVFGEAETQHLFGSKSRREWRIGTLSRDMASEVIESYVSKDIAVAAELMSIVETQDGMPLISVTILGPARPVPLPIQRPALSLVQ
tara:strand:- start:213 stop:701 length:489 start_codon:yes stop_codon:yes gene_type:complete